MPNRAPPELRHRKHPWDVDFTACDRWRTDGWAKTWNQVDQDRAGLAPVAAPEEVVTCLECLARSND